MTRQIIALVAVLAVSLLTVPAIASASDAIRDGYGGLGRTESQITPGGPAPTTNATNTPTPNIQPATSNGASTLSTVSETTPAPAAQAGTLPFTGLDLGLVVVAGVLLLAVGYGLRRLAGRPAERL